VFISFFDRCAYDKQLQKLLLFQLTDQRQFGLGTLKIREIMPFRRLSRLPHSHHAIVGTATFRNAAVPVIDMAAAIGYPALSAEERAEAMGGTINDTLLCAATGALRRHLIESKEAIPSPRLRLDWACRGTVCISGSNVFPSPLISVSMMMTFRLKIDD